MNDVERPLRVLVVDDEPRYVRLLRLNLERHGFETLEAFTGIQAVEIAQRERPDLILLDIAMPGIDGLEACRRIRQFSQAPIIMLTAKGEETDKVLGLDTGADDYLAKPFGINELLARIRAVMRRLQSLPGAPQRERLAAGPLLIDFLKREVFLHGQPVRLSPTEYRLLEQMALHPGQVLTKEQLLTSVWGPGYDEEDQHVRLYISRLRQKIEEDPKKPARIVTRTGMGYLLRIDE